MAQVYNKMNIDVNNGITSIIIAVQNDAQSRFLDVVLIDGATPIDLTGHEVRIYGHKYDNTEFYNNGEITDAAAGRCQFELTSQALSVANDLQAQIIVYYNNEQILSTQPFTIHVVKSLISDSAIESSNEYGALVVLYQNLYEAYDLMTEMVQKIGEPGAIAQGLSLDTMFEVWDWMIDYLQDNSTAGVVDAIGDIQTAIGATDDTGGSATAGTLMAKMNSVVKSKFPQWYYDVVSGTKHFSISSQSVPVTDSNEIGNEIFGPVTSNPFTAFFFSGHSVSSGRFKVRLYKNDVVVYFAEQLRLNQIAGYAFGSFLTTTADVIELKASTGFVGGNVFPTPFLTPISGTNGAMGVAEPLRIINENGEDTYKVSVEITEVVSAGYALNIYLSGELL